MKRALQARILAVLMALCLTVPVSADAFSFVDVYMGNALSTFLEHLQGNRIPVQQDVLVQHSTTTIVERIIERPVYTPTEVIERHFTVTHSGVTPSDLADILSEAKEYTTKAVNRNMDSIDQPGVSDLFGSLAAGDLLIVNTDEEGDTLSAGDTGTVLQIVDGMPTWVATSTLGFGATGVTSVSLSAPEGFIVSGSPVTDTGTLTFAYDTGYGPVLTASSTNWNSFFDTPSTRIIAGSGLSWAGNTLSCATADGSILGCLSAADWTVFNDKVSTSSIDSLAEIEALAGISFALTSDIGTTIQGYDAELADLADGTITTDFVNTANPWADNEVSDILTISGGTIGSNNVSGTLTTTDTLIIGDGGDAITVNSSNWDISSAGIASGFTGFSSSGTINFSGLTASRLVATDASKNLVSTLTLANLIASLSDVSASTGTGNLVLSESPTFTGTANFAGITAANSTTTGSAYFSSDLTVNGYSALGINALAGSFTATGANNIEQTPVGSVPFSEDFSAVSATTLASWTPDVGTGWTPIIQTNNVELRAQTGSLDVTSSVADSGVLYTADGTYTSADYEVKVDINTTDSSDDVMLLAARIQDADNFYAYKFSSTNSSTNNVLYKKVGGVWTALGSSSTGVTTSSTIRLRVVGNRISVYLNDTLLLSVVDSDISAAGKAGLGAGNIGQTSTDDADTTWSLDNFVVTNYEVGTGIAGVFNGNVGIGTTTPSAMLHIMGGTGVRDIFAISSSTGARLLTVTAAGNLEVAGDVISKGMQWIARTTPADNYWNSVTYGNGVFVAVASSGTGNRVMTSPDGINWRTATSAANNSWNSVTYGNGLFVAVAESGTGNRVMTSPDGINWTSRSSAADNSWRSITYGNGMFVAVSQTGTGNRVMTSPDGINWTIRSSAADNSWNSITYGNGLFVAVSSNGTGNRVMTSPDGINWTSRTSAADNAWYSVTYGNGMFVAVSSTGSGNNVMISSDGISWTSSTPATNNSWFSVTYGNGLFVAVSFTGTGNRVMTSPDGINWTSRTSAADNSWRSVTYGNGIFVAVSSDGTGNRVMTSGKGDVALAQRDDLFLGGLTTSVLRSPAGAIDVMGDLVTRGIEWTSRPSVDTKIWQSVTYGNGMFVAVSDSTAPDNLMTSPDGVNWTPRSSSGGFQWGAVAYGGGQFVAVRSSGVLTSPDGVNWTLRSGVAPSNNWWGITYGNGLFVAVATDGVGNRVMTSPDGIVWTARDTTGLDNNWRSVTYGNGLFVAVATSGTGNRVMTSPDGINWTSRTSAADNSWYSVTYGNGLFVAVANSGTGNRVMTSPDGINWTSRTSAADNSWNAVTYGNGLFVAVASSGTGNRVMTSPDGINWTSRTSAANNSWQSVAYGNGVFVAVSSTGTGSRVMTSGKVETNTIANNNTFHNGMSLLSGSFGIGTTTPTSALYIQGNFASQLVAGLADNGNTTDILTLSTTRTSLGAGGAIAFAAGSTARFAAIKGLLTDSSGNTLGDLTFATRMATTSTSLTERLRIVGSNGFVGIGTANPGVKLEVVGDIISKGTEWTSRTSAADNNWRSVTYGNGLFVAVSNTGSGNRVMTSPDGINWTSRTSAADNSWNSVTYGNGMFVAVASGCLSNCVMTSPDGINWTSRSSAAINDWRSVTYGNGLFVAVSSTGTGNRVMTSPDGINWTSRTSAADNFWYSVTYGNGLFVAVAQTGTGNRVMTSPDGINWTIRSSAADNSWASVVYGNGMFVAVAYSGTGNRVMTSGKTETSALAHNNIYQGGMSIMGGNIGIGTTSPTAQLHTTGTVRFQNFGSGTLQTDANGNLSVSSDERLKVIEGKFSSSSVQALLGIEPIQYRWASSTGYDTETLYTGFSAQNIRDFIPEAVGEDKHGFLTLSDRPILATVINAIKEIWAKMMGYDEKIQNLEDRIRFLEDELNMRYTPPEEPAEEEEEVPDENGDDTPDEEQQSGIVDENGNGIPDAEEQGGIVEEENEDLPLEGEPGEEDVPPEEPVEGEEEGVDPEGEKDNGDEVPPEEETADGHDDEGDASDTETGSDTGGEEGDGPAPDGDVAETV